MHVLLPSHDSAPTLAAFRDFVFAYLELLVASWSARDRGADPRENPVPLGRLRHLGVRDEVLLWMQYQAHAEQLQPFKTSEPGSGWAPRAGTRIDDGSFFALTGAGETFADLFLARVIVPVDDQEFEQTRLLMRLDRLVPRYDPRERLLSWGGHLLKRFRQPSPNQELILKAAEELRWPDWFDDPLPRDGVRNAKVRLHDTIKDLNRRQCTPLIHFKGDGTGLAIGWELR